MYGVHGLWSIGELAERAGVTVKTVRFYSDRGLLPEAGRSSGGHRRYGPEALERLQLIRSLRTLDLPVPEVERVLDQEHALEHALEDVVAGQLRELGSQLAALRWREAALQLIHDCPPEERAERLRLVGAVSSPPSTDAPARFWRLLLPARLPARLITSITDAAVPTPPAEPTPAQVLAFARLHALTADARPDLCRPGPRPDEGPRPAVLYDGLAEAYALAATDLTTGRPPHGGDALDCFVAAHAASHGTQDSPAFRRQLGKLLTQAVDPFMTRYWQLAAELASPTEPTMGAAHDWLLAALTAPTAPTAEEA